VKVNHLRKIAAIALILGGIVLLPTLVGLMIQPKMRCIFYQIGVNSYQVEYGSLVFLCALNGLALGWMLRGSGLWWSLLAPTLMMAMIAFLLRSVKFLTIDLEYPNILVFSALGAVVGHCARVVAAIRGGEGVKKNAQDTVDRVQTAR
jgi:hypothetical protein